jgi:hypothetical protein
VPAGTVVRRTADANVVATGAGNFRAYIYAGPVNYLDPATGQYEPINDALVPAPAGSGAAWVNAANSFRVALPAAITAGPVRVSAGGVTVAFQLVGGTVAASGSVGTVAGQVYGATVTGATYGIRSPR